MNRKENPDLGPSHDWFLQKKITCDRIDSGVLKNKTKMKAKALGNYINKLKIL